MKKNLFLALAISSGVACGSALANEDSDERSVRAGPNSNASATQDQPISQHVQQVLQEWPQKQRDLAMKMINKYGNPSGAMPSQVTWNNPGSPWSEITIYRETVDHDFPIPHQDYLEQAVLYQVPPDKMDELTSFDGSVIVYHTKGRLAARCDQEGANILALNLAQDIIAGEKSVEEARSAYADAIKQMKQGNTVAIMQELQFEPMTAQSAASSGETVVQR